MTFLKTSVKCYSSCTVITDSYRIEGSGYWSGRKSLIFGPTDRKQTFTQT